LDCVTLVILCRDSVGEGGCWLLVLEEGDVERAEGEAMRRGMPGDDARRGMPTELGRRRPDSKVVFCAVMLALTGPDRLLVLCVVIGLRMQAGDGGERRRAGEGERRDWVLDSQDRDVTGTEPGSGKRVATMGRGSPVLGLGLGARSPVAGLGLGRLLAGTESL